MKTNTPDEKRQFWSKHIKDWRTSGQTQAAYCQQNGLRPNQLTYWKKIFSVQSEEDGVSPGGFVGVEVAEPALYGLRIQLPNGIQLENVTIDTLPMVRAIMEWIQ